MLRDPADLSALAGMQDWAVDKRLEETYWIIQMITIETKTAHLLYWLCKQ